MNKQLNPRNNVTRAGGPSPSAEGAASRSHSKVAPREASSFFFKLGQVSASGVGWGRGGGPGGVCRASSTCCLSSLAHRGADSLDAGGQLLTGDCLLLCGSPTRGLRGSAAEGRQRCQRGWRRSRSWQEGGGDCRPAWVACLPQEGSVRDLQ